MADDDIAERKRDGRRIKDIPDDQRPRERLLKYGPKVLTDEELLAILFRTGVRGCNVHEMSRKFVEEFGPIWRLRKYAPDELHAWLNHADAPALPNRDDESDELSYYGERDAAERLSEDPPEPLPYAEACRYRKGPRISGLGPDKLATLAAALELGARIYRLKPSELAKPIARPSQIAQLMFAESSRYAREGFWVIYVDRKRRMIMDGPELVTLGVRAHTVIEPAVLFRRAVMLDAHGVFVVHNHPSGDVRPSDEDIGVTQRLINAGRMIGIPVLDHVIVGRPETMPPYLSLREREYCSF